MSYQVWILLILLVIHLILCLITFILLKARILKSRLYLIVPVLLIPIYGFGMLLVQELRNRGDQEIQEEIGVEQLKINDDIYRSIMMDEDETETVVPLEEALKLNDNMMRRGLMLDVMYSDVESYVDQLKEARSNDDTEVVHYAVTALVELQKEYDQKFQALSAKLIRDPDNLQLLNENIELSEQYIGSGLLEGNALQVQLRNYSELLSDKLAHFPDDRELYQRKAEADLQTGDLSEAYNGIQTLIRRWPRFEQGYLLLIQYNAIQKDRKGIEEAIRQIRLREVHLTPEGRSIVEFWEKS